LQIRIAAGVLGIGNGIDDRLKKTHRTSLLGDPFRRGKRRIDGFALTAWMAKAATQLSSASACMPITLPL
jgi:hypothetical protein